MYVCICVCVGIDACEGRYLRRLEAQVCVRQPVWLLKTKLIFYENRV